MMFSLALACPALAQSPIPTFDKEAVTVHPYNRTGRQDVIVDEATSEAYLPGNTGTDREPAFFVRQITLTGFPLPDEQGRLKEIVNAYSGRSVKVSELKELTDAITKYAKGSWKSRFTSQRMMKCALRRTRQTWPTRSCRGICTG